MIHWREYIGVKRERETWLQSRSFAVEYAHSGKKLEIRVQWEFSI